MADFIVDTTADTVDAHDGVLSLREALARADRSDGADTIRFADAVQGGTIVLAGSQLTVASDVTIDGGSGVTIDGNRLSRVLLVQDAGSGVTLDHLSISGGYAGMDFRTDTGGGIRAEDGTALFLDHVTVWGNFSRAGGGIDCDAITLVESAISDNAVMSPGIGGGIRAHTVYARDSTIAGNFGGNYGGGISADSVILESSTIANNRVLLGHGSGVNAAEVILTNCTVSGNRIDDAFLSSHPAAIDGTVTVANSIIAGNFATYSPSDSVYFSSIGSNGHNIFGSNVGGNAPGDLENITPDLLFTAIDSGTGGGVLADNGGPTWTIALRRTSDNPALGGGDASDTPGTDQRGVARPQPEGTGSDVGAFELDQSSALPPPVAATFVVTTSADVSADDDLLSLREALTLANADSSTADRIEFAPELEGSTIALSGRVLTVASDVAIDGGVGVTIDATGASRVLLVEGVGTNVTLQNLIITGGRATGNYRGGGVYGADDTTLTLDHVSVVDNAGDDGGGIAGDIVSIVSSVFSANSGGAISGTNVSIENSCVHDNFGIGLGGLNIAISNSVVEHNTGLGVIGQTLSIANSTVTENGGPGFQSGGIRGQEVSLVGSTVSNNVGYMGAGIEAQNVTLVNSTVSGNQAEQSGGGIYAGSATIINSTITGNSAGQTGSGALVHANAFGLSHVSTFENSIVAGNIATPDGQSDVSGAIDASNGHNIFGSDVAGNVAGDLESVAPGLLFAALDPATGGGLLADHGGPTWTIALRDALDNPALGGADPADAPASDQRGVARPQPEGTAPDVGAFELGPAPLNPIDGTVAADVLHGTAVGDLIRGLPGGDVLWGFAGDDRLVGGYGDDVLVGGPGIDQIQGDAGADRFVFRQADAAPPQGPTYDEILGFVRAEHDVIDLRPIDARAGQPGDQAFALIGREAFTGGGQLRYEATADGGFLVQGNTDADLAADFAFVVHTGLANLKEVDFLL